MSLLSHVAVASVANGYPYTKSMGPCFSVFLFHSKSRQAIVSLAIVRHPSPIVNFAVVAWAVWEHFLKRHSCFSFTIKTGRREDMSQIKPMFPRCPHCCPMATTYTGNLFGNLTA